MKEKFFSSIFYYCPLGIGDRERESYILPRRLLHHISIQKGMYKRYFYMMYRVNFRFYLRHEYKAIDSFFFSRVCGRIHQLENS